METVYVMIGALIMIIILLIAALIITFIKLWRLHKRLALVETTLYFNDMLDLDGKPTSKTNEQEQNTDTEEDTDKNLDKPGGYA